MHKVLDFVDDSWTQVLEQEFSKDYMDDLRCKLRTEKSLGKVIFPPADQWFNAFYKTRFQDLRVIAVGQDPYHGPGQAHGLSFSVPAGVVQPPSLKNIFSEIQRDLDIPLPQAGDLSYWAEQGVLLLNAALTVESGNPGSHGNFGWHRFTQAIVQAINDRKGHVAFLAWGKFAHGVCSDIDQTKHLVVKTSHPSPLGAHRSGRDFCAFRGSSCFSKVNAWLESQGLQPVDWRQAP